MGFIVRIKSRQEKSKLCKYLRNKGYSQKMSPFLTHCIPFDSIAVFDKNNSFYGLHSEDAEFFMENETMIEINYKDYTNENNTI